MSTSLVADYNSDSSSGGEETYSNKVEEKITSPLKIVPKSKREGPVKIVVDLPESNQDGEEEKLKEKPKRSRLGDSNSSGLFDLLPAPKRPAKKENQKSSTEIPTKTSDEIKSTGITGFVPHTLKKRKPITTEKTSASIDSAGSLSNSFFPLGDEITNILSSKDTGDVSPNNIKFDPNELNSVVDSREDNIANNSNFSATDEYTYDQWQDVSGYQESHYNDDQQVLNGNEHIQSSWGLDEEVLQQLGRRRGRNEGPIVVKEINAADQMADAWQSQMADLSNPFKKSGTGHSSFKPTKGQKRKHNLMYLAHQASVMENDLKEQHSLNKKTKRETQAKY
ncbi:4080_t:CDS:2, partial [Acaulospora morrowiae]